jgi:predicted metal-binding membrane protein
MATLRRFIGKARSRRSEMGMATSIHLFLGRQPPRQLSWLVIGAFVTVCAVAWFYLWRMEVDMPGMGNAVYSIPWTPSFAAMILAMWVVMMAAMMLPTALPMLLLVARLKRPIGASLASRTVPFTSGYLLVWTGFAGLLTGMQWLLNRLAMGYGVSLGSASLFSAGVLLLAGIYQWLPWKNACLQHCQTPMGFLLSHWREGELGALRMGFDHGLFCLGCCWMLMVLMLVGGAMNLVWMAGLTLYLLLERSMPARFRLERISGVALIGAGFWLMASHLG